MTELKTLKDLEEIWFLGQDRNDAIHIGTNVCLKQLRAEAIKWIKKLSKDIKKSKTWYGITVIDNSVAKNYAQVEWIKHFFNITEADLK